MANTKLIGASTLLVLLAAPITGAESPFPIRGVIEGYYGEPWNYEDRIEVIDFMSRHGLNTFVYAPKLDPYQRKEWRIPYPEDLLAELLSTAEHSLEVGVAFGYSVSPGWGIGDDSAETSICYSCEADLEVLLDKLAPFLAVGVRTMMLSFDDVWSVLVHPEDQQAYDSVAEAQSDLANRLELALTTISPRAHVMLTPTEYCGTRPSEYLDTLRRDLSPSIDVMWTGTTVYSPEINKEDALAYGELIGRPPVIWDNYPVNDITTANSLHLGPLYGRAPDLYQAVGGLLANPMLQPRAGRLPLTTVAAYLAAPETYEPEAALEAAIVELGEDGADDLRQFALQCQSSAMNRDDAVALRDALDRLEADYEGAWWLEAAAAVDGELAAQAAAGVNLPDSLPDPAMGLEIERWLARFRLNVEAAQIAANTLRASRPGLHDLDARRLAGLIVFSGTASTPRTGQVRDHLLQLEGYAVRLGDDPTHVHGQRFQYYPNFGHMDIYAGDNVVWNFLQDTIDRARAWLRADPGDGTLRLEVGGLEFELVPGTFEVQLPDTGTDELQVVVEDSRAGQAGYRVPITGT